MILEVYIDKMFFFELSKRTDKEDELLYDFKYNFLKRLRNCKVWINTAEEELRRLYEDLEYFAWVVEVGTVICDKWTEKLEEVSLSQAISKLFLIGNSFQASELQNTYGHLYINNNNLLKQWKPVRVYREEDYISVNEFAKPYWKYINDLVHPYNSVLIFDRYLLNSTDTSSIENNLIPLLQHLLSNCCSSSNRKEVAIISELHKSDIGEEDERLHKYYSLISKALSGNAMVEVIKYDRNIDKSKTQKEHDRFILTNFLVIESGSGFNVYDKYNKAVNHTKIAIRSLLKNSNRNVVEQSLKNLSAYATNLVEKVQVIPPKKIGELPQTVSLKPFFPSKTNRMINYIDVSDTAKTRT